MSEVSYVLVGRVRKAHGIRGEVVVETLTDAPDAIFASGARVFVGDSAGALDPKRGELTVVKSSDFKEGLLVKFDSIADRNEADLWRGRYLLVPESEIAPPSEDQVFIHALYGMAVRDMGGESIGVVKEVYDLPQGLLLEIERAGKPDVLVPFHESSVHEVDSESRVIVLDPPAGLLE
ncbi:MAG: Ribosome maturation factor rimM [Gemmatimonadetes bacterium]|nr:Ribosome maturation factor rimM [Gemmatimonadota bacterium]